MKERTVLIIDDNVYKKIDIQRALALLGVSEVDWSRSLENAKEKIRLRGANPYSLIITDMNYPLTEGDKAFYRSGERLVGWVAEEGLKKTANEKIHIGQPIAFDPDHFLAGINALMDAAYSNKEPEIRRRVAEIVTTYHPDKL